MKRFFLYLFLLILPLLLLLPFPIYCLYVSGELMSFDMYIHSLERNQLWGLAYNYCDREYKFFMTDFLKPDIVELGTSRSMQVDGNIFNSKYSFYNAGGAAQNSQDFYEFVKNLNYNPKLIIIDLNHFFFNPRSEKTPRAIFKKPEQNVLYLIRNSINFYGDLLDGKIDFTRLLNNNSIGLKARMVDDGFTRTGFYNYGRIMSNYSEAEDYNLENTIKRIKAHNKRFQTCNSVDMSAVNQIEIFLLECKKRGIKVVGFLPPFAHKTIEAMEKDGNYQYVIQIFDKLQPLFDRYNFFLFDYTDATKVGGEDYNFIDGFHAGVIVDNLIFKDIISKNEFLSDFFIMPEQIDSINTEYEKVHPRFHDLPSLY